MESTEQRIEHLEMADKYLDSNWACPYCGGVTQFLESEVVDQSTEHMVYVCEHCDAVTEEIFKRVGLHFPESGASVPLPNWQDTARI